MDTIRTTKDLLMCNGSAQPVMVALMPNEIALIALTPDMAAALIEAEKAPEAFAEAWDVATQHRAVTEKLTMGQIGELAAHEVSGIHYRNAAAALATIRKVTG